MSNTKTILLGRIFFLCLLLSASAGCTSKWTITSGFLDLNSIAGAMGGWRSVPGPTGEAVNVYPMHGASVQSPMANVSRLQRAGDGFLLMFIDDKIVTCESLIDYVEITPGTKRIVLAPGQDAMFSYEMTEEIYLLVLEIKPNAWYIFRTRILEEGHKTEPVVRGTMRETKRQVTLAPFEVIEIQNGVSKTVATTRDFAECQTPPPQSPYQVRVERERMKAEQGDPIAQFNLGVSYANGQGVPVDKTEAVKWFRKAADQGLANAQYNLGHYYLRGEGGLEQNSNEGVKWWRKAAEGGHAGAQNNLGAYYHNGDIVERDQKVAVSWWQKAAEQGNADAQCSLGIALANGEGVPVDKTEAVKWFRKAADQGIADAQHSLGYFYLHGEGCEQNSNEAVKWWRKAAEGGNAFSQSDLGVALMEGIGTAKNDQEAISWWRKAAEQGHAAAQCHLGIALLQGTGVIKDYPEAIKLLRKAAEQGDESAKLKLVELGE